MKQKTTVTKTINPLHFEDLEPHRFEDLVRQLAYGFKQWRNLEATGRLGKDEGIDIRGVEGFLLDYDTGLDDEADDSDIQVGERVWVFQCKRYKTIGPKLIRQIVEEATVAMDEPPYGLIIATACDVTKATMDAFRAAARAKDIQEFDLWTKARLEDLLFLPRYDHLLFAYFGLSLATQQRSQLTKIRHRLKIKRKMKKLLEEQLGTHVVLIMDASMVDAYPSESAVPHFADRTPQPWFLAKVVYLGIHSLMIARKASIGWLEDYEKHTWDMIENGPNTLTAVLENHKHFRHWNSDSTWEEEQRLKAQIPQNKTMTVYSVQRLHYDDILEIDSEGNHLFDAPHLYCSYRGKNGPFADDKPMLIGERFNDLIELNPQHRVSLFR